MANRVACEMKNLQQIPVDLQVEEKHSDGGFFQISKEWLEQASGAYDLMNFFKRFCTLFGKGFFQSQLEGYLDAAALPRLPSVTISLVQRLDKARSEKKSLPVISDVSHQIFDVSATACYACAFFKKQPQPVLKAASLFDVFSDATDVSTYALRCCDFEKKQAQAKMAPRPVQQEILNERRDSWINLIRAVTAVAFSIFACFLILTGTALVPTMAAVTIGIANSIFTILAYYHKNYWCNVLLKIN